MRSGLVRRAPAAWSRKSHDSGKDREVLSRDCSARHLQMLHESRDSYVRKAHRRRGNRDRRDLVALQVENWDGYRMYTCFALTHVGRIAPRPNCFEFGVQQSEVDRIFVWSGLTTMGKQVVKFCGLQRGEQQLSCSRNMCNNALAGDVMDL